MRKVFNGSSLWNDKGFCLKIKIYYPVPSNHQGLIIQNRTSMIYSPKRILNLKITFQKYRCAKIRYIKTQIIQKGLSVTQFALNRITQEQLVRTAKSMLFYKNGAQFFLIFSSNFVALEHVYEAVILTFCNTPYNFSNF